MERSVGKLGVEKMCPEPRVTCVHVELQLALNSIALVHEGNVLCGRLSVFVWHSEYFVFFSSDVVESTKSDSGHKSLGSESEYESES